MTRGIESFVPKIRPGIGDRVTRAKTGETGEPLVAMDMESTGSLEQQIRTALDPDSTNHNTSHGGGGGGGGGPPSPAPPSSPGTDEQIG